MDEFVCASNIYIFPSLFSCDIVLVLPNLNPHKSSTRQHLRLRYVWNNEIANFHHKIHDLFVFNSQITLLKNRFTLHVNGGNCLLLIRFITDYSIQLCLSLTHFLLSCIPEERMRSTFVINAAITNCWCCNIKNTGSLDLMTHHL